MVVVVVAQAGSARAADIFITTTTAAMMPTIITAPNTISATINSMFASMLLHPLLDFDVTEVEAARTLNHGC